MPGQFEAVAVLLPLLTKHPRLLGQLTAVVPGEYTPGGGCVPALPRSRGKVGEGLRP